MLLSAIAALSQAALLVENKREKSASPVLFVVPVVQSIMQQQNRIAQEIRKQIHLSCCEYILAHPCRFNDPAFAKNSKALAAEDNTLPSPPQYHWTPPESIGGHRSPPDSVRVHWSPVNSSELQQSPVNSGGQYTSIYPTYVF